MSSARRHLGWRWTGLALLALAGKPTDGQAQARYRSIPEEPRWLKLRLTDASLGVYAEGAHHETSFGSTTATYDRLFVGPSLGLGMQGSVYHPNLLSFVMNSEGAVGWGEQSVKSATTFNRSQFEYLGNAYANFNFLSPKPYHSTISIARTHAFRDYDFFNRVTVDGLRYGVTSGYDEGPVPVMLNFSRQEEDLVGVGSQSYLANTSLSLEARHERAAGNTRLSYNFNDYLRRDFGIEGGGQDHSIGLFDTEVFGSRRQFTLNTLAGYTRREFTDSPGQDWSGGAGLSIEHRPNLSSYYDFAAHRTEMLGPAPATSQNYDATVGLRHRLYESLTSNLRGQWIHHRYDGPLGGATSTRYRLGLGEAYTKRLSGSARLTLDVGTYVEHADFDSAGTFITVIDEPHSFSTGGGGPPLDTFFLSLPFVDVATIVVTDTHNTLPPYVEGLDYTVGRNGALTYIRRLPGSRIPANATVYVDYTAATSPSGNYNSLTTHAKVRLELWNGLLGFYGRVFSLANDATPGLVVQDTFAWGFGSDLAWRWFRAGAEFEIFDSTLSSYDTLRLYQSAAFRLDDASSLNLDLSESWTTYHDANREEQNYTFTTRYNRLITPRFNFNVEAGLAIRSGPGVDHTRAVLRPGFDYRIGKTSIKASYDFEYGRFLHTEERFKHLVVLRIKRTF